MQRLCAAFVIGFALVLSAAEAANAQLFQAGGTYKVIGTNFVTDYNQNVTLDQTSKLVDGGQIALSETLTPDGSGGQWAQFNFATVNGGPLAGNSSGLWEIQIQNIPLVGSALYDGGFVYWTVNGTAVSPLTPFSGFHPVEPNPIDPSLGPVYAFTPGTPTGPFSSFDVYVYATPYSSITLGGIDPSTANDFHFAVHALPAVPEPGACALIAGLGLTGAAFLRGRRAR